ncbi:MAG: hypothetical protein ACI9SP_001093 [Arenicella sp.]|jgi:hypothetical protein
MSKYLRIASYALLLTAAQGANAKSTIGGIIFTNSYIDKQEVSGKDDSTQFVSELANNSRFRVRWSNEDNVGMYVELGLRDDNGTRVRHAYGQWEINEHWQILAGKTSTPFSPLNPSVAMVRNSGQSVGNTNPSRQSQVRLTRKFQNRKGAVAISFSDPNGGPTLEDAITGDALGDRESSIPRIDIGAAFSNFNWQVFPSAFYSDQSYTNIKGSGSDDSVTSWGASLGVKKGFGSVILTAEYGAGQNWGNTRMSTSGSSAGDNAGVFTLARNGATSIADNDNQGGWVDLGFRFKHGETKGVIHIIAGELSSEVDDLGIEYNSSMIGISVPIDLPWIARGFRIRPEVFIFDDDRTPSQLNASGVSQDSKQTIAGVQLQYTF